MEILELFFVTEEETYIFLIEILTSYYVIFI